MSDEPHPLSLRRISNQIVAAVAVVFAGAGIVANPGLPEHYLLSAMMVGLVWGGLRCMGFGDRQWQNTVIILLIMLGHQAFCPLNLARPVASWLSLMAFFAIALLGVFFVVWLKERDDRRMGR
ncbi:MAG: hypothetical protein IT582_07180 [Opitutaceae bacterium]|nr:hypothetical protein [Opitutaceae bacterium]